MSDRYGTFYNGFQFHIPLKIFVMDKFLISASILCTIRNHHQFTNEQINQQGPLTERIEKSNKCTFCPSANLTFIPSKAKQ